MCSRPQQGPSRCGATRLLAALIGWLCSSASPGTNIGGRLAFLSTSLQHQRQRSSPLPTSGGCFVFPLSCCCGACVSVLLGPRSARRDPSGPWSWFASPLHRRHPGQRPGAGTRPQTEFWGTPVPRPTQIGTRNFSLSTPRHGHYVPR